MSSNPEEAGSRPAAMSVVDCSETIAGRFAASVLGGRGARVVRPLTFDGPTTVADAFVSRGVTQLAKPSDPTGWDELLRAADVLLVSSASGPWGTWEDLAARHPQLSVVAATPYGLDFPAENATASTLTLAAESGFLGITGQPEQAPEAIRGHVLEFACGWAIHSAVWAVYRRQLLTGAPSFVDLSFLEMFVFLQWNSTQRAAFENVVMQRQGARGMGHPWGVYPCKDGHVILIVGAGGRNWKRFAELMEAPQLADERYLSPAARAQHADEIDALMLPWLMDHTAEEIFTLAQEANLPFGMVRRPRQLLEDPQLSEREFFVPDSRGVRWPQLPFRIDGRRPTWPAPEMEVSA